MIKIVFTNGDTVKWEKKKYTDYKYDGRMFIIIRDGEWIALYNIDSIVSVVIK